MTNEQIDNTFSYHKPVGNQPERYERIRAAAKQFAHIINECCPPSREASLAFTDLQRCVQMANASIAITEAPLHISNAEARLN